LMVLFDGSGISPKANSMAALSQMLASSSSYSVNGDHSAQPLGPSKSRTSLVVMPLNLTRMGIDKTRALLRICSLISGVISTLLV